MTTHYSKDNTSNMGVEGIGYHKIDHGEEGNHGGRVLMGISMATIAIDLNDLVVVIDHNIVVIRMLEMEGGGITICMQRTNIMIGTLMVLRSLILTVTFVWIMKKMKIHEIKCMIMVCRFS